MAISGLLIWSVVVLPQEIPASGQKLSSHAAAQRTNGRGAIGVFCELRGDGAWEDGQENLPDAATLRRLFYRFVHTRLAKTHGGHSYTQAVAGQIFVPSNPDAPAPSE